MLAVPALLFAGALLIRLPHLFDAPSLTDEAHEVLRGLDVAEGRIRPLTNVNAYLGSMFNWLLAGLFVAFGPTIETPRIVVAVAGAATVAATYLLARELELAPRTAILAAGLLATCGTHILVSSHVAWSHSLTPLFATLALWQVARAVRRASGVSLAMAGVTLGLSIQTHASALALGPGIAGYVMVHRPSWPRTPWPYLAGALVFAMNANLLAFNVASGGGSLAEARIVSVAYTRTGTSAWDSYFQNLERLALGLGRSIAGAVDIRPDPGHYLFDPTIWLVAVLALLGITLAPKRQSSLTAMVALPYLLAFPVLNPKWEVIPNGRFLAPVLPLLFISIATGLRWVVERATRRAPARVGSVGFVVAGLALVLLPLFPLARRYEQMAVSIESSIGLLDALAELESRRAPDEWVALDPDLDKLWLDGGGDYEAAFRVLLRLRGIPHQTLHFRRQQERGDLNPCQANRIDLRWVIPARSPEAPRLFRDDPATPEDEGDRPYWQIRTVQRSDRVRDARRGQADEWRTDLIAYAPPLAASGRAVDRCAPGRLI